MKQRALCLFAIALSVPAMAQTTTNITGTIVINDESNGTERFNRNLLGTGAVGMLGNAVLNLGLTQNRLTEDYATGTGPVNVGMALFFNSLDQISINFQAIQDPDFTTAMVPGTVNTANSRGVYAGAASAQGGLRLTLSRNSTSPLSYQVSLTGSANVGGQAVNLAIVDVKVTVAIGQATTFDDQPGTCSFPPLGSGTVTVRSHPDSNSWDDKVRFLEITITCSFSSTDSLRALVILTVVNPQTEEFRFGPLVITGGTGRFAGAAGSFEVTSFFENPQGGDTVNFTGTITEAGPTTPIITSVTTAYWLPGPSISQNDWIQIKGTNLVPASTPAGGRFWSDAPEFAQGRMPTEVGGISVTVNGKPAYVWWFCSKATTSACAEDQINVLTPLDDYEGLVLVVVKNGAVSSGAFQANKVPVTPSLLRFTTRGDAVATHADGRLLGPTTLFPGLSTPGQRGETISLWAVGFGLPTAPLTQGSATQTGSLPFTPNCFLGGEAVIVTAALVSPGLYQLNVTIPNSTTAGDQVFYCTTPNNWTLAALIAVQ